jgi:hypothetical protein
MVAPAVPSRRRRRAPIEPNAVEDDVTKRMLPMLVVVLTMMPLLAAEAEAEADDRFRVRLFGAWITSGADQSEVVSGFPGPDGEFDPIPDEPPLFYYPNGAADPAMQTDPGKGAGFGASFEWKFAKRWGVEVGAIRGSMDTKMDFLVAVYAPTPTGPPQWQNGGTLTGTFDLDHTQAFLGVNWHAFPPEKKIDFFVGLYAAWLTYDDTTTSVVSPGGGTVFDLALSPDDGTGFGLNVGFDWQIGNGPFMITGAMKYTGTSTDITWASSEDYISLPQPLAVDIDPLAITIGAGLRF